jgi:hypothetical protein
MSTTAEAVFDLVVRLHLPPRVVRAYWSRERAWPGDTLRLCVETKWVPDGTEVAFSIRSAALEPGATVLATAKGTVEKSRCVVDHRVDWNDDALGELFALGVKDCRFCFEVAIEAFALVAVSPALYVPFEPIG